MNWLIKTTVSLTQVTTGHPCLYHSTNRLPTHLSQKAIVPFPLESSTLCLIRFPIFD